MTFTHPKDAPEGHKWKFRWKDFRTLDVIHHPDAECAFNIVAIYDRGYSIGSVSHNDVGKCSVVLGDHPYDLIDVPVKHEAWMNIYSKYGGSAPHKTKADADRQAMAGRIACIRVEYEEGEGL
jgi:hypothetical protein